jgi:uncharacterized protein involved in outer membrane biogenesis
MSSGVWASPGAFASWSRVHMRRGLIWLIGILAAIAVIGFLLLPIVLKPVLEKDLSAALDRKVAIGKLQINPFALSATLSEVSVADRGAGAPMVSIAEVYANGELTSIFRWAPVVAALKVTHPSLNLVRNDDKTYNFSDILERAASGPPGPPPRFAVNNIEIVDGQIDFDDRPEHRKHQITQIKLGIPFLSSLPSATEIRVEPSFAAQVNGRPVVITGETRPFKDSHETVLHFDLSELALPAYMEYVPVPLPIKVVSGVVGGKANVSFIGRGKDPPQLTIDGAFKLADLAVIERSGARLVRVPSLAIGVDRFDVFGNSADFASIVAEGVDLDLRRDARGGLNLETLFPADKARKKDELPFRFRAGSIKVERGTVRLTDASVTPAFASTLSDVSLTIDKLASTGNQKAGLVFSFASDTGARMAHRGTLSLSPLAADGKLEMKGLQLGKLFPYYASALNLVVDDGTLDGSTDLRYDGGSGALTLTTLDATASNLKMRLPDEKDPLWRVPTLAVHGGSVDVLKHAIGFESIELHGAVATIRRAADGTFNFSRLIRTHEASPSGAAADTWDVQARKLLVDDLAGTFTDATVTPAARIALSKASLSAENLSPTTKVKGRWTMQATVNKRGAVSATGPFEIAPFLTTLNLTARNIDLVPFQPYISESARVVVTGGNASMKGTVSFTSGSPARGGFKGDVVIADLAALDEANQSDLLKWKTLSLSGVDAQLEPLAITVGDIALDRFFARLLLNENGEFNLQQLSRDRPPASEPPKPTLQPKTVEVATPPTTATTWLKLGKTTLTGGEIDFTDHFIRPNYSAHLTDLSGGLSTLAFDQPADIDLKGNVQGNAPLQISGRINPLGQNLFLDIKATATDIDLPPLSPYSGKYVGYDIQKGKLSMKVAYFIEDRKLKAENSIILDQLTFGQKVESPDAIKAPVHLAVSLLKDRNGVIRFDLPIGGSLDDPKFSVGGLIFRAIVGLIVKIVTAPFAILGSLGKHGEELAYIEFAPGSSVLDSTGNDKIKDVAKALTERPAVKLDVAGRVDPASDREALKRSAVARQVKAQKFNDLVRSGEPPPSVDVVKVEDSEYEALLARAYKAADFAKPKNAIGFPKDIPRAEMEALLLQNAKVNDEDLRSLADRRAQVVRSALTDTEHVPSERVFLVAPRLDAEGVKDKGKPTRVDFALH